MVEEALRVQDGGLQVEHHAGPDLGRFPALQHRELMQADTQSVSDRLAGDGQTPLCKRPFTGQIEVAGSDAGPGCLNGLSLCFPEPVVHRGLLGLTVAMAAVRATSD